MLGFIKPHRGQNNVWDGQTVAELPDSDMPQHEYNGVYVLLVLMHTRWDYLFEGMASGTTVQVTIWARLWMEFCTAAVGVFDDDNP